jgi:hypothetical protein
MLTSNTAQALQSAPDLVVVQVVVGQTTYRGYHPRKEIALSWITTLVELGDALVDFQHPPHWLRDGVLTIPPEAFAASLVGYVQWAAGEVRNVLYCNPARVGAA